MYFLYFSSAIFSLSTITILKPIHKPREQYNVSLYTYHLSSTIINILPIIFHSILNYFFIIILKEIHTSHNSPIVSEQFAGS